MSNNQQHNQPQRYIQVMQRGSNKPVFIKTIGQQGYFSIFKVVVFYNLIFILYFL